MLVKFALGLVDSFNDIAILLLELQQESLSLNELILLILALHQSQLFLLAPSDPCCVLLLSIQTRLLDFNCFAASFLFHLLFLILIRC